MTPFDPLIITNTKEKYSGANQITVISLLFTINRYIILRRNT